MGDKMDFDNYDYEASDSEHEYTEREKNLLKKVRKGKKKEEENEEMFAFDESDDEPERFEADSDLEEPGDEDTYMPDVRAWGKKKSEFYGSHLKDNRRQNFEREEEIANLEQEGALEIQKRLASELNENDFNLDMFTLPQEQSETPEETIKKTKTDLSDLSKKQKLAAFKAEAPEFDGLVQDFEERLTESKDMLIPTLDLLKSIEFPSTHPFVEFLETRNELIVNYCTNISFYLMLKAKRVKVRNHPLVKRLVQFRQLICQLDDIFEYVVKPQIEILLAEKDDADDSDNEMQSSKLKMLETIKERIESANLEDSSEEGEQVDKPLFNQEESSEEEQDNGGDKLEVDETGEVKRQITRQIAKNKGLTVSKRKELRNPRVKNKLKFKKAVIRRKGAVRPVRSKVELYSGEASGVKTHIKRSIKIK